MQFLRVLLIVQFLAIIVYTGYAVSQDGWNLFPFFFNGILALDWPGQFHFDFLNYLLLSGLWIAWRHRFSGLGIFLGVAASILGILFLAPYLLMVSLKTNGDVSKILLGDQLG